MAKSNGSLACGGRLLDWNRFTPLESLDAPCPPGALNEGFVNCFLAAGAGAVNSLLGPYDGAKPVAPPLLPFPAAPTSIGVVFKISTKNLQQAGALLGNQVRMPSHSLFTDPGRVISSSSFLSQSKTLILQSSSTVPMTERMLYPTDGNPGAVKLA